MMATVTPAPPTHVRRGSDGSISFDGPTGGRDKRADPGTTLYPWGDPGGAGLREGCTLRGFSDGGWMDEGRF